MKFVATLSLLLALVAGSFAQAISYKDFKREASQKINLQPEYGKVNKTAGQIESDNEFIKTSIAEYGSKAEGSKQMIKFGFDYLYRGDLITAMKRFNQAWLLNNKNEEAYWGYASVYFSFGDYNEALKYLNRGLSLNPQSANLLTDKATIFATYYAMNKKVADLDKAIELFRESYNINSKNPNTLFKLSVAYFYKGDCQNAKRFLKQHDDVGGNAATKEYAEALAKQCK